MCKNKSVFQNEMFKVDDSKENKEQNEGGITREGKGRVIKRKLEKERKECIMWCENVNVKSICQLSNVIF